MSWSHSVPAVAVMLTLGGCDGGLALESDSRGGDGALRTRRESLAPPPTGLDLAAVDLSGSCQATTLSLSAAVKNHGLTGIAASRAGIYAGEPATGGTLLTSVEVPWLYGAEAYPFQRTLTVPEGTTQVFVVADDDRFYPEDDEVNNTASLTLPAPCVTDPGELNQPPVARCQDVTVVADDLCQGSATIDQGSFDPDQGPGPLTVAQSPQGPYPAGTTPVQLAVSDGEASSTCTAHVTVVDTTAPVPGARKDRVLAPSASSGYVQVNLSDCALPASDNCGGTLDVQQFGTFLRVTSDETDDALSLLRVLACDDIRLSADGKSVRVRAEAALLGNGRVYTLTYAVSDAAGNSAIGTCKVSVPALLGNPAVDSGTAYCQGTDCPPHTGSGGLCSLL
ncbi:hypothetical protein [Pyxidicoccus xibeiensis]|uniref:hypothetical protein n=1 Tax=Pyxidicoccus xibeiensis TaxID=2906759 RepID=UPI0020A7FC45|nr:hypothetical protein [Pyxidicoccus xibeiensis]MCP3137672.1 hypothetical protein [Pyxidicoccus xibeiensis]